MTKVKNILNQMSIFSSKRRKDQLPDSIIDSGKDVAGISGTYKANDAFKPYTISGSGEFHLIEELPKRILNLLSLAD